MEVADELGSLLPGVTATLSAPAFEIQVVTDPNGVAEFANLVPTTYRLRASFEGFRDLQVAALDVIAAERLTVELIFTSDHLSASSSPPIQVDPQIHRSAAFTMPSVPPVSRPTFELGGLSFRLPKGLDAPIAEEEPDGSTTFLLKDATAADHSDLDEGETFGIRLLSFDRERSQRIMPALLSEASILAINGRDIYRLPGFPGPYGETLHFYVLPLPDGTQIGFAAPRLHLDGRPTGYDGKIEELIGSVPAVPDD